MSRTHHSSSPFGLASLNNSLFSSFHTCYRLLHTIQIRFACLCEMHNLQFIKPQIMQNVCPTVLQSPLLLRVHLLLICKWIRVHRKQQFIITLVPCQSIIIAMQWPFNHLSLFQTSNSQTLTGPSRLISKRLLIYVTSIPEDTQTLHMQQGETKSAESTP